MKEVDTSDLKKTSPASSARSTPTGSKTVDKAVESKDDEVNYAQYVAIQVDNNDT